MISNYVNQMQRRLVYCKSKIYLFDIMQKCQSLFACNLEQWRYHVQIHIRIYPLTQYII